ncbi:MAG TPA: 50S ribosomal protein L32 [Candidatus Nanoarchaeia archaeon]
MAAQPKKKMSKARSGKRWATKKYSLPKLISCPKCGSRSISHRMCPNCGYYKQTLVFEPKQTTKVSKVSSRERE